MIEHSDQKGSLVLVQSFLVLHRTQHGIGFIGQSHDHIGTAPSHPPELFYKSDAIEYMAGIDKKSHQGKREQRRTGRHHGNHDKLHGTGKDEETGGGSEQHTVTRIAHKNAEGYSNKKISEEDRKRIPHCKS